jgi:sodium-dependent dicarboxylate transporter 2/3/5
MPTPEGLTLEGQRGLAILGLCVVWWLFTPVALPVTSLLGMGLLPVAGIFSPVETLALFGNQAVLFVIGVFVVAAAMLQSGLSSRLALWAMRSMARSENTLAGAVLVLSALLCLFVVSHAVAALMLPIVMGLIHALDLGPSSRTARRLVVSMAWGTIIGSNLTLLASARATLALEVYGTHVAGQGEALVPIGFLEFTAATAGICFLLLGLAWVVLRVAMPPEGLEMGPAVERLDAQVQEIGAVTRAEWKTLGVLVVMVPAFVILGPQYGLGNVALVFAASLFALGVLQWDRARSYVNWGIVLLYGGAIAIGGGLAQSGAMEWVAQGLLPAPGTHPFYSLVMVVVLGILCTAFVANAAVIALLLPALLIAADRKSVV